MTLGRDIPVSENVFVADPELRVRDQVRALGSSTVTSADLVELGLRRIEEVDESLGAVISLAPNARRDAALSDARRKRGQLLSALDGVPFTVKDCIDTGDVVTTHGSSLFANWTPAGDAPVVSALREAGMVLLAKTSLDDFAASCYGESSLNGFIHNPRDLRLGVGGSSGGSAVSVAAGYASVSIGTDTGGSLRIPAALTGVATLRPTQGLLSTQGIFPRSFSQDTPGPMAADVDGLYQVMNVLCDWETRSVAPQKTGRLGVVCTGLALLGDDPEGEVMAQFDSALKTLAAQGFTLVPLEAPSRELLDDTTLIGAESAVAVDSYLAQAEAPPVRNFRELVESGSFTKHAAESFEREAEIARSQEVTAKSRSSAHIARRRLREYTDRLFVDNELEAMVYPSVQFMPAPLGVEQPGVFTRWSEHTGRPALGIPMPTDGQGDALPASLELLGHVGEDGPLLEIGMGVETALGTARGKPRGSGKC